MKHKLVQVLKFFGFLAVGLFLFWLVYKDQNIEDIKKGLSNVHYFWIFLSLLLGLLSHISRALRWKLLIESLEYRPYFLNSFMAVMIGYFFNLVLPRLGEVSRCGALSRYEGISFTKLVGTVIVERSLDMIMLLLLLVIVLATQMPVVSEFLSNNPGVKDNIVSVWEAKGVFIALGALLVSVLAGYFLFRDYLRELKVYQRIKNMILEFWRGIKSIRKVKNISGFVFHSVMIWILYYLMLYVSFFAFDFTSEYSMLVGLTVFVMASFGMVAPVQGGIGAWHFMAIATLFVYGVEQGDAQIFALVVHGTMTLLLLVAGLLSIIGMPFYNNRSTKDIEYLITDSPE